MWNGLRAQYAEDDSQQFPVGGEQSPTPQMELTHLFSQHNAIFGGFAALKWNNWNDLPV